MYTGASNDNGSARPLGDSVVYPLYHAQDSSSTPRREGRVAEWACSLSLNQPSHGPLALIQPVSRLSGVVIPGELTSYGPLFDARHFLYLFSFHYVLHSEIPMLHSLRLRAGFLLLTALLLPLTACDSGGSNDDEPEVAEGRVNVSISGEASSSFEGFAYFYEATDPDPDSDDTVFGLVLSSTDTENPGTSSQFIFIARQSSRPGTGTYDFVDLESDADSDDLDADRFAAWVSPATSDESVFGFYFSNGGTLTIDRSSDDGVAGRFEINATGFQFSSESQEPEEINVTIEGAFDANPSPSPFFPFGDDPTS